MGRSRLSFSSSSLSLASTFSVRRRPASSRAFARSSSSFFGTRTPWRLNTSSCTSSRVLPSMRERRKSPPSVRARGFS